MIPAANDELASRYIEQFSEYFGVLADPAGTTREHIRRVRILSLFFVFGLLCLRLLVCVFYYPPLRMGSFFVFCLCRRALHTPLPLRFI